MERIYNKLVRDNIPEIIKSNGEIPITRVLSLEEYKKELERKLLEEYNEVIETTGIEQLEELADMLEVISALANLNGKNIEDIIEIAKDKSNKRGAFKDKIYLEKVIGK